MEKMLVGLETEYGIRCDTATLISMLGMCPPGYLLFALQRVRDVLPKTDYVIAHIETCGFWTRSGMRMHQDRQAHIEVSTPECATFEELIFQKNAGESLLQAMVEKAREALREGPYFYKGPFEVVANNTALADHRDNSGESQAGEVTFGRHENYLLRRDMLRSCYTTGSLFSYIFEEAGPFLAVRHVLGGAGHITPNGEFVLSPRVHWLVYAVGHGTTASRTLVNSRDEPHADAEKFLRYHHIAGDTNITDNITEMTTAFTYWVLRLVERGWISPCWFKEIQDKQLFEMVEAVNHDPTLKNVYKCGERSFTASDILLSYLDAVDKHRGVLQFDAADDAIFRRIASYLERAKGGPEFLFRESEWATKFLMMRSKMDRSGISSFDNFALRKFSIALHNIDSDPARNEFAKVRNSILPPNLKIANAPKAYRKAPRTRAFARGLAIYLANRLGLRISIPDGCWSGFSISSSNDTTHCDLNKIAPWELTEKDIKEVVATVRDIVARENAGRD